MLFVRIPEAARAQCAEDSPAFVRNSHEPFRRFRRLICEMRSLSCGLAVAAGLLLLASCSRPSPPAAHAASSAAPQQSPRARREGRVTGTIQAVHFSKALVPPIYGQGGSLTLTRIIPNGSRVKEGHLAAEFDATQHPDTARDAQAR